MSTFQGLSEVVSSKGLFCALYADRGSHYWHTPEAGGPVDKDNLTQVGRARVEAFHAARFSAFSLNVPSAS